ncbi:MAG: N(4)-(beta-N-acetylglucosaminyl)-L-asparaginase [Planctomycetes bacterium]|nr:N(4)-(beta-N-acetylglucosaminyl)-L-asparaginase [Planctomycetota bacterium]
MHESPSTRRSFLAAVAAGAAVPATLACAAAQATEPTAAAGGAVGAGGDARCIASGNGLAAVATALAAMRHGQSPVDAAVAGVNLNELDPEDDSVGYGGLPNEEGVVELDAAVMDGPTHRAGAVASLRNIKTPSRVALQVMRRSDHVLLVGEGALRFARAHGFSEENLLTEKSRKLWLHWKETLSAKDDWFPPTAAEIAADPVLRDRPTGTIHLSARDAQGDLGCTTTTSGLAFKIPGRVGDSPLIGDGLYLDNEVGSAGGTGRGEASILACGAFAVVERMRSGRAPLDACLDVLARVVDQSRRNGNADGSGRPTFNLSLYALAKDGRYGSASLIDGPTFAVADAAGPRLERGGHLFASASR